MCLKHRTGRPNCTSTATRNLTNVTKTLCQAIESMLLRVVVEGPDCTSKRTLFIAWHGVFAPCAFRRRIPGIRFQSAGAGVSPCRTALRNSRLEANLSRVTRFRLTFKKQEQNTYDKKCSNAIKVRLQGEFRRGARR